MISEEQIERLTNLLIERVEEANLLFIKKIGESVKQIGTLTPSQAHTLANILKYGGNYEEIVSQISKLTKMNVKQIDEIFYEFAKKDQTFYEQFYKYRDIPFVPIQENVALRNQVLALSSISKKEISDLSNSNLIGYTIRDNEGNVQFLGLKETYNRAIDEAVLNVGQGKETFDSAMYRILKDIGGSGLKTIDFKSGRTLRLDSAINMHLKGALRDMHNEMQKQYGAEFGADGVEISAHYTPAPDHAEVQGRQFSNEEFENFQNDRLAVDYEGKEFEPEFEGHDRRSISQYNCYHYIFSIILGVSEPAYSKEELQKILDDNEKGFDIDGKHYTKYQGEQMQRQLERKIRENKDLQILGKASGNEKLMVKSQQKINSLTDKYNELCEKSGLKRKSKRLRVSGYRKVAIK